MCIYDYIQIHTVTYTHTHKILYLIYIASVEDLASQILWTLSVQFHLLGWKFRQRQCWGSVCEIDIFGEQLEQRVEHQIATTSCRSLEWSCRFVDSCFGWEAVKHQVISRFSSQPVWWSKFREVQRSSLIDRPILFPLDSFYLSY